MDFITYININQELKTIPLQKSGPTYSTKELDEDYLVTAVYLNDIRQFVSNIQSASIQIAVINEPTFFDGSFITKKDFNLKGTFFSFLETDVKPLTPENKDIQKVDIVDSHKTVQVEVTNFPATSGGSSSFQFPTNFVNNLVFNSVTGNFEAQQKEVISVNDLARRTDDEIYLAQYCQLLFPNEHFVIKPFIHHLSIYKSMDSGHNVLFFSHLDSSLLFVQNIAFPDVIDPCDEKGYINIDFRPKGRKYLFTSIGYDGETPIDYVEEIFGYCAIFDNVLFAVG